MWKFEKFSVTHILREIILGVSKSNKSAVLQFQGSEFGYFGKFQPSRSVKIQRNQNSEPLNVLKLCTYFCTSNIPKFDFP